MFPDKAEKFPDFDSFFMAVHPNPDGQGFRPFPWQRELVNKILASPQPNIGWPEVIDVPTGLGKTAVLDVAVYLAARLSVSAASCPYRRIFFVVDRRIVVDEAYEHARRIAESLEKPTDPAMQAVAQALRQEGDDGPVLDVTRMRGGVTWDARWVERPDRYAIVTGTVDQIGSRLLFRGYGVTPEARPIDAALVGTDSIIFIDEAHLAGPLIETVEALREMDPQFGECGPAIVRMSATYVSGRYRVHSISPADEQHPIAGPRLRAGKTLYTIELKTKRATAESAVPDALARLALLSTGTNNVVGVVTNTVARARVVFERVKDTHDAVLLTGRTRPIDRDYLLHRHYDRIRAGRPLAEKPFVLVATQTIEVGADIDLNVLITESASLDALVQRLGRLNRRGRHTNATALVVHDTSTGEDDPVYGPARLTTWAWLAQHTAPVTYTPRLDPATLTGGLDASPLALRRLMDNQPPGLVPPAAYTPVLPQSTLDAWVRTSPEPNPDSPIEPYLHGITEHSLSIRVVWRVGLPNDEATWAAVKERRELPKAISRVPVTAEEELEVPLVAVRRWLRGAVETPILSDQDTESPVLANEEVSRARATRYRDPNGDVYVLRVASRDEAEVITANRIRPGDLIVVPVEYGGCDAYGWHPTSTTEVVDVADLAYRRGRPLLRIGSYLRTVIATYHSAATHHPALDELLKWAERQADPDGVDIEEATLTDQHLPALANALNDGGGGPLARNLAQILRAKPPHRRIVVWGDEPWYVVVTSSAMGFADDRSAEASSMARQRMRLDEHQCAVTKRAAEFARNLRLAPDSLRRSVELAASLHDEGKRDPRFQAMLWGGDHRLAEIAEYSLAKSDIDPTDRAAYRRARVKAGYPRGMRHEALSAQIAADQIASIDIDEDLVIHLIAAHHGFSRPLLPPISDPAPQIIAINGRQYTTAATVDWAAPARFARLNQRYGRWGLARLETIVRLADMWCSARGEREPKKEGDDAD